MSKLSPPPTATAPEEEEDAPLDPAVERVRRKLQGLLLVSTGVMLVGFLAVALALVYRFSVMESSAPAAVATVDAPPDDLVSAVAADGYVTLILGGDDPRVEVRRLPEGDLVTTLRLAGAPPPGAQDAPAD